MKKYLIIIIIIINSCSYPELILNQVVYFNDFENNDLENISGGVINKFNESNVLGFYNKDGFNINLNEIPDHDYIFISFDLYIHGTWDGNVNGFPENDKADLWTMELRPGMDLFQKSDQNIFKTTFSNSPCFSNWCKRQSYPQSYPFENTPYSGAETIDLPRTCDGYWGGPSSLYKIEKSFESDGQGIVIRMYDELYQPNAIDYRGISAEKCDESWSIDNLEIRIIKYE